MVICRYYLNGNCRYGTKCMNEHFDVKPLIKTEIEAAVKGSQWPLSCFGPFKEKPCLQNFIEDVSFEEARFQCYDAKARNNFEAYQREFGQQIANAQNKFKMILSFQRDIIGMIINLYNGGDNPQDKPNDNNNSVNNNNNPFGSAANGNMNQNLDFGNSKPQFSFVNPQGYGGYCGSTSNQSSNGTLFNQATFASANSFPNNPVNFANASNNLGFNAQAQAKPTFSFVQPQQNQQNTGFVQQQQQQQQQNVNNGLFANMNTFSTGGSAFGVNSASSQELSTGFLFAQPQQTQSAPLNFSQNQMQQQQQFYGQTQIQQPGGFGQPVAIPDTIPFNQNIETGSFNQPNTFGMDNSHQQEMHPQNLANAFQSINNNISSNQIELINNSKVYSDIEDMNVEMKEAFEAPTFTLGRIPPIPPPRHLC